MTDSIIERAAKAITPEWERASANTKRNARLTVAAVLEAAREPTEAMTAAGAECSMGYVNDHLIQPICEDCARPIWSAMIDAALSDKPV